MDNSIKKATGHFVAQDAAESKQSFDAHRSVESDKIQLNERTAPWVRFWRLVSPEPNTGCWLWSGAIQTNGYGSFGVESGKSMLAHRFAYESEHGPIPRGLVLDHKCKVRACCNPAHLEPVTTAENNRRGDSPNHRAHRLGKCSKCGGAFSLRSDGRQRCAECNRTQNQEYRRRAAEAAGRQYKPNFRTRKAAVAP